MPKKPHIRNGRGIYVVHIDIASLWDAHWRTQVNAAQKFVIRTNLQQKRFSKGVSK